jgi:hypothetical protein
MVQRSNGFNRIFTGVTMKTAVKLAAALLGATFVTQGAEAGYKPRDVYIDEAPRRWKKAPYRHSGEYRHILVESVHSSRRVIVPVRPARLGLQVKLPGGAWVDCEITCEYTVRRMHLDFWEGQGQNFTSPGYFRKRFYLD